MSNTFIPTVTLSLEQYENLIMQTECIDDLVGKAASVRNKFNNFEIDERKYIKELGNILAEYMEE